MRQHEDAVLDVWARHTNDPTGALLRAASPDEFVALGAFDWVTLLEAADLAVRQTGGELRPSLWLEKARMGAATGSGPLPRRTFIGTTLDPFAQDDDSLRPAVPPAGPSHSRAEADRYAALRRELDQRAAARHRSGQPGDG